MDETTMDWPAAIRRGPVHTPKMFNCALGNMALALDPTTEADPAGVLATLATAVSAMVGNGTRVMIGDARHPLLIWTLLAGKTSSGRKGTAGEVARRVLAPADPPFWRTNILSGLSSAEGLIATVADRDEDEEHDAATPRDKRRLVVETEYGVVLTRSRREGNALPQILREAWDGRDLRVQTRFPLVATAPHIAVTGHISPTEFRARVSSNDLAGGSYNRFLVVHVERSRRLPEGGGAPQQLVDVLAGDLHERLTTARGIGLVARAPEARDRWHELYNAFVELEDDEQLQAWVGRAVPYTMRLAALYAALDGTAEIGIGHLEAAAAFVNYALTSVRHIFATGGAGFSDADRVAAAIKDAGPDGIAKSHLTKKFGARLTGGQLDEILEEIVPRDGFIREQRASSGGRPAVYFSFRDVKHEHGSDFFLLPSSAGSERDPESESHHQGRGAEAWAN